jgi:lantibiotic modifying enzyme
MVDYKSLTEVEISGSSAKEIGHTNGLAAVITRLVELIGEFDKEKIKMIATHLMDQALADIDKMRCEPKNEYEDTVKEQAKAAIKQALLPLIEIESVQ